jgi:hypothetical protein
MKLSNRHLLISTVTACGLLISACSSKSSDGGDDTGNPSVSTGGVTGSQGGSPAVTGGKAATGGKVATGGKAATGGKSATSDAGSGTTGGSQTLAALPKACQGVVIDPSVDAGATCTGSSRELEPSPLDMLLMIDRTMSMSYCLDGRHAADCPATTSDPSRWQVLQSAVNAFMTNPDFVKQNPRVGFGYFGATGNPDDPTECLAATYAVPDIAIEGISTVSSKILSRIAEIGTKNPDGTYPFLGGQTPWQPSLWGALQYAQAWQQANPLRATVVVFVTDGYPTECDTNMNNILETVGEYFAGVQGSYNLVGKPTIRTYLVGIGTDLNDPLNGFNLDSVAQAGGTGAATIANSVASVNDFATAMANISNSKIDCDFALPPVPDGMILDPNLVQVIYQPYSSTTTKKPTQEIPAAGSAGACGTGNGGWYFDNPSAPTKVTLCPCSCANLGSGKIAVKFGCRPTPALN